MTDFSKYEDHARDVDKTIADRTVWWKHTDGPATIGGIFVSMDEEPNKFHDDIPEPLLKIQTPDGWICRFASKQLVSEMKTAGVEVGDDFWVKFLVVKEGKQYNNYAVGIVKKAGFAANDSGPKGSKRISVESTKVSASASSDDDFVDDLPDVEDSTKNTKKQGDLLLDAATDAEILF